MAMLANKKIRDVYILLIIVMIGILIRLPIGSIGDINTSVLYDPDSYLYARRATELNDLKITEWTMFVNRADDPLMNTVSAENCHSTENFLPILVAFVCKIFRTISIEEAIYFFNAIVCPLAAIPAYFFIKKYTNEVGGMVSALAMAIAPSYFFHTMSGYCDTDGLIMIFATTLIICQFESLLSENRIKKVVLCLLSLLITYMFYLTWEKYYVYVAFSLGITFVVLLINWIKKLNLSIVPSCISQLLMLAFCFVFSRDELIEAIVNFRGNTDNWPTESYFIGELEIPSLIKNGPNSAFYISPTGFVNWLGGMPWFIVTILVVVSMIHFVAKNKSNMSKDYSNIEIIFFGLLAWALVTLIIVRTGIRFVQLSALPLNLMLGLGIGLCYQKKDKCCVSSVLAKDLVVLFLSIMIFGALMICNFIFAFFISILFLILGMGCKEIKLNNVLALLIVILFACPIFNEYRVMENSTQFVDDDLIEAVEYIKDNTNEDSTVVSWWNNGYYFEFASKRQTVADGGIYNGMYFYWLSNVFITEDENLASGICRMLQTGNLEAVNIVQEHTNDEKETSKILKEILVLNPKEAKKVLAEKYNFSSEDVCDLMDHIYSSDERDIYLVLYDDLKTIVGPIGYYGLWNFEEDKFYKVSYSTEKEEYIYPPELKNSIIVNYLEGNKFKTFEEVFSNEKAAVYKVNY